MAEVNNETKTIDTNLIDREEKLLMYSIVKMYTNLSRLKCLPTKKRKKETVEVSEPAGPYADALRLMLRPLLQDYGANKVLNSLLLKLLFRDLRVLYNFHRYDFDPDGIVTFLPGDNPEEIKEHFEETKISLLNFFKVLLKEFNLMKFYDQAADISKIKVDDTNFDGRNNRKIKIVNNLLRYISIIVYEYYHEIFILEYDYDYRRLGKRYYHLYSMIYYTSFYYWIKITNSLLKQYKQTMNNNKLRRKINVRLYRYLSIVMISMCMGEAVEAAYRLIKRYFLSNSSLIKPVSTNDVKKLLGKISKVLNDIYFIMIYGKENRPFLIASSKRFPYVNKEVKVTIDMLFLDRIRQIQHELEKSLANGKLPINLKSESGREDLRYILRTAGEIVSMKNVIHSVVYNYDNFVTKKLNK